MRTIIKYLMVAILILNSVLACTPTEHDTKSTSGVYATGDDSSVRPDNDKDG
ncbi:hypothetical protein [Yeosuana aromativorans]|uniref:hypothetical protein n=1 Tax=Yeosuana aromativorans TaxID=288019 RepID=UPI00166A0220|nr:hypothetical protein [Yeosuana aromativorans]